MKSIQGHLALMLGAGFAILLIVSGSAIYFLTQELLLKEFDASLRSSALAIMTQTEANSSGFQVEMSPAIAQELANSAAAEYCEIWRTNGTAFYRSASLRGADLPFRFGTQAKPDYWNFELPNGHHVRAIGYKFLPKIEDEDRPVTPRGEAVLVVAQSRRILNKSLSTLASVLVATGVMALAIMIPLVRFAVRRGHAPLQALTRQIANIQADSLAVRFPVATLPAELQPIIGRLNDALQRLEASFERERQFSSDLAHELRTPLAELRAQAEVGLQFSGGAGAETHRETLAIALQMQSIVTRLLDLARCQDGKIPTEIKSHDLGALVEESWSLFAAQAEQRNLVVQIDLPAKTGIKTDAALFRSILVNLFSNATTYTPEGGMVAIVWQAGKRELAVSNSTDDLEAADMPQLFERLWRKDRSRTGPEHSGLGLALSRAFAETLGMHLTASLDNEKRLTLTLAMTNALSATA